MVLNLPRDIVTKGGEKEHECVGFFKPVWYTADRILCIRMFYKREFKFIKISHIEDRTTFITVNFYFDDMVRNFI